LLLKIEKQRTKTTLKEVVLKGKISDRKELIALEKELEDAQTLNIPKEDLELIQVKNKKGFKDIIINKVMPALKQAGKEWVEKSRAEKEAYRKSMEKK